MGLFFQVFMSCFAALLVLKATDRLLKKLPRRRLVELSSSTTVRITLDSGSAKESEDREIVNDEMADGRDLWERLEDAGFSRIEESRDLRVADVGMIKASLYSKASCFRCSAYAYDLSEVYLQRLPSQQMPIGSVALQSIGAVCARCGCVLDVYEDNLPKYGRLAPLTAREVNFFDVLQFLENLGGDSAESSLGAAELSLLEKQRDELERQLGAVRSAIMRKKHESGAGDVFREADRATGSEPSEEVTSTGSEFQKSST